MPWKILRVFCTTEKTALVLYGSFILFADSSLPFLPGLYPKRKGERRAQLILVLLVVGKGLCTLASC